MRNECTTPGIRRFRLAGLTLIELLVAAFALVLLLLAAGGATRYVRDELKRTQTAETLRRLDEAVGAYCRATGAWPEAGKRERGGVRGSGFGVQEQHRAAAQVLAALRRVPASWALVERIAADVPGSVSEAGICDAWGTPLRCLTADSVSDVDRQAVAANGGRPVFISDGPDGDGADELRSDGIHESPTTGTQRHAEERTN